MTDDVVGDYRTRLFVLLGAVGFVLLIACGNLANLLLARGAARSGELAIRAALGAGRARIVRQLLTESLILALAAAVLGLAFAQWGIRALVALGPPGVPRLDQARLDGVVLLFTVGVALLSALIFGLAPAVRAAKTDLQTALRESGRSGAGGVRDRLRTVLIVGELALALLLLSGAALLIQSALALQRVPPGFNPDRVLSARLSLPAEQYNTADRAQQTFESILEQARAIPGVRAAAITSQVPRGRGGNGNGLVPEGRTMDAAHAIGSRLRMVTPGYFDAMGIPITRGRALTDQDRRGALKVMVISEALARAAFPNQDAIGRRIACCESLPDGSPDYKTVVGVAGDVRSTAPGDAPTPEFYLPIAQVPPQAWQWIQRTMYVVVRTTGDPASAGEPLRAVVRRVAPGRPAVRRADDGRAAGRVAVDRAVQHAAADAAGRDRAAAGGDRDLRRHRVLRLAPHAGDRRPHGARRHARRRRPPRRRAGGRTAGGRSGAGRARLACADECPAGAVVRRQPARSAHARRRRRPARVCRVTREPGPGAQSRVGGSDAGASGELTGTSDVVSKPAAL